MNVNLSSAVASSCDVFFYRLAEISGIDMIHDKLQKFGLDKKHMLIYMEKNEDYCHRESGNPSLGNLPGTQGNVECRNRARLFFSNTSSARNATALLASGGSSVTPHLFLRSIDRLIMKYLTLVIVIIKMKLRLILIVYMLLMKQCGVLFMTEHWNGFTYKKN